MAVHPIHLYPDKVLRKPNQSVSHLTAYHRKLINDLIETMHAQPGGIGIAAPQIGYSDRIAIVDVSSKEKGGAQLVLINPEIIEVSGEVFRREGCMSIPNFTANVKRSASIRIRWNDENFKERELVAHGLQAICIQHEIDHLNGLLFLDKVASLAKDVFRRKRYL